MAKQKLSRKNIRNALECPGNVLEFVFQKIVAILHQKTVHGGVILLVKLQDEACNFTKSITPP